MAVRHFYLLLVITYFCYEPIYGMLVESRFSNTDLYNMIQRMNQSIASLEKENLNLKQQLTSVKQMRAIAFYASLTNPINVVGDHQTIEYDNVKTNIGNAYDPRHGHFVAPVSGVYLFAVTVMGEPHEALQYDIIKNGNIIGSARAAISDEYETGTSVITLSLVTGDMVWVRYCCSAGTVLRKIHGGFNTFSGALISVL